MKWIQKQIELSARKRGVHLITGEVLAALTDIRTIQSGMLNIFIQHTSASLAVNENADPDVRCDLGAFLDRSVRENEAWYRHVAEGSEDMPAHIKSVLTGTSLSIPVCRGRLGLGIWQGIYLLEHRNHGGSRRLMLTAFGEES
jgi:secondary thiamine-phosphate synthase enzyme